MTTFQIQIRDKSAETDVNAELHDEITQKHLKDWQSLWRPALEDHMQRLRKNGIRPWDPEWPQSGHWDWPEKMNLVRGMINHAGYSVTCRDVTQGLMLLNLSRYARIPGQEGQRLVYIEYLEVAPWNWQKSHASLPSYRSVGQALMRTAFMRSIQEGYKGRLGLHSLPQAVDFYDVCGMKNLGTRSDEYDGRLPYLEATPNIAEAYLKGK